MKFKTEEIKLFVNKKHPYLGINKQREVSRLLFKIAKREHIDYTLEAAQRCIHHG